MKMNNGTNHSGSFGSEYRGPAEEVSCRQELTLLYIIIIIIISIILDICMIMLIIIISSLLNYILIITIHFVFIGIFISGRSYNFSCAAQVVLLAPTEALYF